MYDEYKSWKLFLLEEEMCLSQSEITIPWE